MPLHFKIPFQSVDENIVVRSQQSQYKIEKGNLASAAIARVNLKSHINLYLIYFYIFPKKYKRDKG